MDLMQRITQLFGKAAPAKSAEAEATTTAGVMDATFSRMFSDFFQISSERMAVYDDMEQMEVRMSEIGVGLDTLAECATISPDGSQVNFRIEYEAEPDERAKEVIDQVVEDSQLRQKSLAIAREVLLYGDKFLQVVVDRDLRVRRVMSMPVKSMHRNEDERGLLKDGPGEWAFEQRQEKTNLPIAGFYPWQIVHVRWARKGESKYGRPLLYSSRSDFKKLQAMEEALTVNWLTRAFARLLFMLDVTGKSEKEAQEVIKRFRDNLTKRKMQSGALEDEPLSVIRDIFMGTGYTPDGKPLLQDVRVLDTSNAGFANLAPVEYYRSKVLMGVRVPRSYLGLEQDVNAKATLEQEEQQMARLLRWVQMLLSEAYTQVIDLGLLLAGFDPKEVAYRIVWPNPSRTDERVESETAKNYAQADEVFMRNHVVDNEWVAKKRLRMTDEEWDAVQERILAQAQEVRLGSQAKPQGEPTVQEGRLLQEAVYGPPRKWLEATDSYERDLVKTLESWGHDAARDIAQDIEHDPLRAGSKLDDYLMVLLNLLLSKGWQDIPLAFYLGFGSPALPPELRTKLNASLENNDHFLETSFLADLRGTLEGKIAALLTLLKPEDAEDELLAAILGYRNRLGLYAGEFWHGIHQGWAYRREQDDAERVRLGEQPVPVRWNLDPLAYHCPECLEFGADPPGREYSSMQALLVATGGILPGQGTTCNGNCRCWLEEG